MIRSSRWSWFAAMLVLGGMATAQEPRQDQPEPPVRLKKKMKPQPDSVPEQKPGAPSPKTDEAKKPVSPSKSREVKDDPEPAEDLEAKRQEILNRLSKNLGLAEERLDNKDPSDSTQQVQRDIVRDLDELIEQTKRRQQQQEQQSASSSGSQSQRSQQARGPQNQPFSEPTSMSQATQQTGNNPRGGTSERSEMSKIADLYKDIWGHLPDKLRQEMDQYSREQFMAKYQELLKQYYATVAEKGRRKGER